MSRITLSHCLAYIFVLKDPDNIFFIYLEKPIYQFSKPKVNGDCQLVLVQDFTVLLLFSQPKVVFSLDLPISIKEFFLSYTSIDDSVVSKILVLRLIFLLQSVQDKFVHSISYELRTT